MLTPLNHKLVFLKKYVSLMCFKYCDTLDFMLICSVRNESTTIIVGIPLFQEFFANSMNDDILVLEASHICLYTNVFVNVT